MSQLRPAITVIAALTLVTGLAYPMAITGLGRALFPHQAGGSLILRAGQVVGSELIAQPTEAPGCFWGRLSATADYPGNPMASGGSNLSPGNPDLAKAAAARIQALRSLDPGNPDPVPADLVTASGSGLDPHISPAAADYQVRRVAAVRHLPEARVRDLVRRASSGRTLGVWGEPRVNVLQLNLLLEENKQ